MGGFFRVYKEVIERLRAAYNEESAAKREQGEISGWKEEERGRFLEVLVREGKKRLLEIGAGTGRDGKFFQEQGLEVICTDLSPAMIKLCREKGLEAYVGDFLSLDFPEESFDAVYALNCLLHVPSESLPRVLEKVKGLLKVGGVWYVGVYGAEEEKEGISEKDWHEPKRFFSWHSDGYMKDIMGKWFEVVNFERVELGEEWHFQSIILRKN